MQNAVWCFQRTEMGNSQAAECSIISACVHDTMAVQRYIRQIFQRKSPNLSRIDVTRTFCAKDTCVTSTESH